MEEYVVQKETYYCWQCDNTIDKPEKENRPAFCSEKCRKKYKKYRKEEHKRLLKARGID